MAIRKCPAPAPAEPAPWPAERPRPKFLSDLLLDQTNGKPTAKRGDGGSESESQVGSETAAAEPKPSAAKLKGSIGEGPNHSNFSHQSSVKFCQNSMQFARKSKTFRIVQHFRKY